MIFSDEKRQKILHALAQKGVNRPCERCGSNNFSLVDGYSRVDLQSDMQTVDFGGPTIPAFAFTCTNCGNIALFAAKALLPDEF